MSLAVLHAGFLNLTSLSLGRLVTDPKSPAQDYWPDHPARVSRDEIDERPYGNLKNALGNQTHSSLRAKITKLIYGGHESKGLSFSELAAPESQVYILKQPIRYFQKICGDHETRDWIEKTLKHFPIFLVVGIITVKEAVVTQTEHRSRQISAGAYVPISDVVTHGVSTLVAPVVGDSLAVRFEGSTGHAKLQQFSFIAPGERVIGVQYRKVKFNLFSSNKVDNSFLEKNPHRWVMLLGGDRAGSNDILEADLEEDMGVDDLELDDDPEVIDGGEETIAFIEE
jgi:hypothetical protein